MAPATPFLLFVCFAGIVYGAVWLLSRRQVVDQATKRVRIIDEMTAKLKAQGIENHRVTANVQFHAHIEARRFSLWAQEQYLRRDVSLDELKEEYLADFGKTAGKASGMLYGKSAGIAHAKMLRGEIQAVTESEVFAEGPCREKYQREMAKMLKELADWHRRVSTLGGTDATAQITDEMYAARGRL